MNSAYYSRSYEVLKIDHPFYHLKRFGKTTINVIYNENTQPKITYIVKKKKKVLILQIIFTKTLILVLALDSLELYCSKFGTLGTYRGETRRRDCQKRSTHTLILH